MEEKRNVSIILPPKVNYIIETLQEHGFEAFAVGGCVRDSLLNRVPDDWDITTSATPRQVKAVFNRTVDTGIQHGTVTVLVDKEGFEVTTYRIDGEYEDSRHPKEVLFSTDLTEDLKRRDFTINAMAYNDTVGLVDIFGGIEDLEQGIIRCVGEPGERFREDALRIMRAVRFAAQLGFSIDNHTMEAIKTLAPTLQNISAERIQTELVKLLVSKHPEHMRILYETGITAVILPEFDDMMQTKQHNPHHDKTVGEHTIRALQNVPPTKVLRLAALFHDVAKPCTKHTDEQGIDHFYGHDVKGEQMSRQILKRLKFDNDTLYKVSGLVRFHDYRVLAEPKSVRRSIHKIGEDLYEDFLILNRADILAQSDYQKAEKLTVLKDVEECYQNIMRKQECTSLKTLAVNGKDLMELGIEPGKHIGECLNALLLLVLDNPQLNTREQLLKEAEKIK